MLLALQATETSQAASGEPTRGALEALHGAVIASRIDQVVPNLGGSVAWSPSGDVFVTEGPEESGLVDLRDVETGKSVRSFVGHDIDINDVAFSPNGLLATTGDDGALRVWAPDDGRLVFEVIGEGQVWGPSFSADSARLSATWLDEGVVRVVDVSRGDVTVEVEVPGWPNATSLSPDGSQVAVATSDPSKARVVDTATGALVHPLPGHDWAVTAVRYSPDGASVATASADNTVHIRDATTGETTITLADFGSQVNALSWTPDSRRVAAGGLEGEIRVVDVTESEASTAFVLAGTSIARGVVGLAFSPDGTQLLSGDNLITAATVWDVGIDGDAEVANLPSNTTTWGDAAYLPEGTLATTTDDGTVTVWDTSDGAELMRLGSADTAADDVRAIAVSPGGALLAAGETLESAPVWNLADGSEVFSKTPDGVGVAAPAFSPDGTLLALADDTGTLNLHERDGSLAAQLLADEGNGLQDPAFSPDGTTVAVVELSNNRQVPDFRLLLWDWRAGTTQSWQVGTGSGPVYSPDGTRLALRNGGGPAEVWGVESGERLFTLEGHTAGVEDVTYSPDGRLIATASFDGTARLWDATTGDAVLRLPQLAGEVSSVNFSPDGRHLATHSLAEGLVRVWTRDPDELVSIAAEKVTRDLTPAECQEYLQTQTCP